MCRFVLDGPLLPLLILSLRLWFMATWIPIWWWLNPNTATVLYVNFKVTVSNSDVLMLL